MNLDHTPHTLVEDHYHIRELIATQERRAFDRQAHTDRRKALEERMRDIKAAEDKITKAFWCQDCKEDFFAESIKEVEVDWSCPMQYIAFYKTKHWCGKWTIRHITDPLKDSYFYRSQMVARDRGKHHNDLIQSFETGYNMLYGKR